MIISQVQNVSFKVKILVMKMLFGPLFSYWCEKCALSTGNLPVGGSARNSVAMVNDPPNMTLTVDHGGNESTN